MCNRYSLNKKRDAVARFFRVSHNRTSVFEPATSIFPRHVAPVVRNAADGERENVNDELGLHAPAERARAATRHARICHSKIDLCCVPAVVAMQPGALAELTSIASVPHLTDGSHVAANQSACGHETR